MVGGIVSYRFGPGHGSPAGSEGQHSRRGVRLPVVLALHRKAARDGNFDIPQTGQFFGAHGGTQRTRSIATYLDELDGVLGVHFGDLED